MSLMKFLLALALVVLVAAEFEFTQEFQGWKIKYNKVYETKEIEFARQVIWESNKKFVENHNANADKNGFTVAMNEFADLVSFVSKIHSIYVHFFARMLVNSLKCTMVLSKFMLPLQMIMTKCINVE